jgi:hypothetical protein
MQLIRSCTFAYSFAIWIGDGRVIGHAWQATAVSLVDRRVVGLWQRHYRVTIDGAGAGPELGQQVFARLVERLQLVVQRRLGRIARSGPAPPPP